MLHVTTKRKCQEQMIFVNITIFWCKLR